MSNNITDETLAELSRLEKAATAGPWDTCGSSVIDYGGEGPFNYTIEWLPNRFNENNANDGKLIAAMRNALPSLLAELRAARKTIWREKSRVNLLADELAKYSGRTIPDEIREVDAAIDAAMREKTDG